MIYLKSVAVSLLMLFVLWLATRDYSSPGIGWKLVPIQPGAKAVSSAFMLDGVYPAGSAIVDRSAFGFGPCDNYPFPLETEWGVPGTLSLVAFADEPVAYFRHRGFALRLINRTRCVEEIRAVDSRLPIVQEAMDENGQWRPIEFLFEPICGNSFHRLMLKPNQYWQFPAREYSGTFKTKLRFRLVMGVRLVLSNEFDGSIDPRQFHVRSPPGQVN